MTATIARIAPSHLATTTISDSRFSILNFSDAKEREYWNDYMETHEAMIRRTATEHAPWYVIPANNKWFTRLVVTAVAVDTLSTLDPKIPTIDDAKRRELMADDRPIPEWP